MFLLYPLMQASLRVQECQKHKNKHNTYELSNCDSLGQHWSKARASKLMPCPTCIDLSRRLTDTSSSLEDTSVPFRCFINKPHHYTHPCAKINQKSPSPSILKLFILFLKRNICSCVWPLFDFVHGVVCVIFVIFIELFHFFERWGIYFGIEEVFINRFHW